MCLFKHIIVILILKYISNNKNKKIKKNIAANDLCVKFTRRFMNPDMSTCWLNSCLQLILSGFDHFYPEIAFQSNLGLELMVLKNIQPTQCIDPTVLKNIIVYAEDTRIATRKSELTSEIKDKEELAKMLENVDEMYLNFNNRQQCVRDFFYLSERKHGRLVRCASNIQFYYNQSFYLHILWSQE